MNEASLKKALHVIKLITYKFTIKIIKYNMYGFIIYVIHMIAVLWPYEVAVTPLPS